MTTPGNAVRWLASALFVICLLYSTAFAAEEVAAQTGLEALRDQVMAILVPVFATFIGGLFLLVLNKVKKRLHLDVSDMQTTQWSELARQAALRGAEWARKRINASTEGKKVPGPEVLDTAVNWATQMAAHQGLPAMGREKLEGLIEAELFKLRQEQNAAPGAPAV